MCVGVGAMGHSECECVKLPANIVDKKGEGAPKCRPSFPVQCPGTQEPGASATAQPLFPWKEPNRQALEAESARVHERRVVTCKENSARGPKKRPACTVPRYAPVPRPRRIPDLSPPPQVATQQLAPVPSQSYTAPSPPEIRERKGSGGEAALPSLLHRPPAAPASPLGERCSASGAGDLAGGGGDRGRTAQGRGRSRPLCIRRGRSGGGRANGRPPGATPRGAIRPPRSGPGPARRALHFLGAF